MNEAPTMLRPEPRPATTPSKVDVLPPCPLTGRPAARRLHGVSAALIRDIWRFGQGVDVSGLFDGIDRFTLYESDTGLVFFEPRVVGDGAFYASYYAKWDVHTGLTRDIGQRVDFTVAASFVPPGGKVIDVGCGPGLFRQHLPHAQFVGLDPYAEDDQNDIVCETLEQHAETNAGDYDVATAFHVIEHVPDPRRHAELMVRLLKPGGLLILAAPLHPSPLTDIPNLPINIPPHHVTWWNPSAFRALAQELGLEVVEACTLPVSPHQGVILWLWRLQLRRTDPPPEPRYIAHRWSWHASTALAYVLARIAVRFKKMPDGAPNVDAFLVARKPAAG